MKKQQIAIELHNQFGHPKGFSTNSFDQKCPNCR